jgi:IS5 family transposase
MAKQPGFFDADERLNALSAASDPLERLRAAVDFEVFRADIAAALDHGIAAAAAVRRMTRC